MVDCDACDITYGRYSSELSWALEIKRDPTMKLIDIGLRSLTPQAG